MSYLTTRVSGRFLVQNDDESWGTDPIKMSLQIRNDFLDDKILMVWNQKKFLHSYTLKEKPSPEAKQQPERGEYVEADIEGITYLVRFQSRRAEWIIFKVAKGVILDVEVDRFRESYSVDGTIKIETFTKIKTAEDLKKFSLYGEMVAKLKERRPNGPPVDISTLFFKEA